MKKIKKQKERWEQFVRVYFTPEEIRPQVELAGKRLGLSRQVTDEQVAELLLTEVYRNNLYQVIVRRGITSPGFPEMIHLSIRRLDRQPCNDWRHFQQIKNSIVGDEHEGVQLFPAESRKLDAANQYHLYILADKGLRFPFGEKIRAVSNASIGDAKQRPLQGEEDIYE